MIDFNLIKELSIVEVNVVKIENEIGQVIWKKNVKYDRPIKLGVEKITANTYAGETTYKNEQFILLDIYPENADSIINVTYEGLTKTLTFNGTNAKQVYFGTFNGVSDSISTPSSGIVTIEGQCIGFGCSSYNLSNKVTNACSCITHVYDFGNITIIPTNAFRGCANLALTELPINITAIGNNAFHGCTNLALVGLPVAVNKIGNYAFRDCTSLKLYSLPNEITEIGESAFYNCESLTLTDNKLPNSLTNIADNCFYNCINLSLTSLPSGITSIGYKAFYNCESLRLSELPSNLISIGERAFYSCSSLTSIVIPDSVTSIGESAFYYCSKLSNIIIGNGITILTKGAFGYFGSNISKNTSVYARVGAGIKSIESSALVAPPEGDGHTIEMTSTTPPAIIVSDGNNQSFGDYWKKIIVPKGYGNVYKTADEWNLLESGILPTYIVEAT